MDIKLARSILVVATPDSNALDVIKALTGSAPTQTDTQILAGLTHQWDVKNKYYSASIPIWVDEVADAGSWKAEFLKPEAKEVVEATGAWIVCLAVKQEQDGCGHAAEILSAVQEVVEAHSDSSSIMLVIATSKSAGTTLSPALHGMYEDTAIDHGFELIDFGASGSNEYGERVGMVRVKEALMAHEWSMDNADPSDAHLSLENDLDDFDIDELGDIGITADMKASLMADQAGQEADANAPLHTGDEDAAAVDSLDQMLSKLLAVREQVSELPEAERKRAAAKAVRQLMNDDF